MLQSAAVDYVRRGSRGFVALPPEHLFAWERDDRPLADESNSGRALQRALAQLSGQDRALYREYYDEDRSIGDIAAELGITYGAAAGRLRRMEKKVQKLMESRKRTPGG